MGSLMAGWSSNPLTAESVMVRSKSSLTKEEIEAFWRSRQKAMEEHLNDAAAQKLADHQQAESSNSGTGSAAAVPIPIQPAGSQVVVQELPKPSSIAASPDWWTRSNWAFLNDPPESHMNYAPDWKSCSKMCCSSHKKDQKLGDQSWKILSTSS